MKPFYLFALAALSFASCQNEKASTATINQKESDSLVLAQMISLREEAMIKKDAALVMPQFSENATWINSQGYFFEGKKELEKFHLMFTKNDSLDYYYEIGKPKIRFLDNNSALAYYSWKMFWFKKEHPADTTFKEIGLMTLSAQKQNEKWEWVAVTNQHTPWFYDSIEPVRIE
ncbi:nuclear transport factor 2 family protein [Flagellimonas myxillae]|uniref:nuclear transport factor 2 family protein n=1 Tax=Flagellimonas myxillae TaxID=2942214 RepID=UPI00201ED84D|nr:nuclear transport factor 2 family protein [Muricauda myxillae]MCL6266900.1 nuclear transport factor 2 family protein [Muricauda myxillae]